MMRKFAEGLVFGAGFAISFVAIWFAASWWLTPALLTSQLNELNTELETSSVPHARSGSAADPDAKAKAPFHELPVEEQIAAATVIALAKFERSADGKMKAVITEFLKKSPATTVYYNVGDEYPPATYFPREGTNYGDGVVIFFTGSPATMSLSSTIMRDRIPGMGDMPLELFKQKCREVGG